jgi:hypothetical protein
MSVKLYQFAGVSEKDGILRVRYANTKNRIKQLKQLGDKNVEIFDLKEPMPKEDCVDLLLSKTFKNARAMEVVIAEAREIGFNV